MLPRDAEAWVREHVEPGSAAVENERPWATTWRIETADDVVFFKTCAPVQAFEPRLTAQLAARHPQLVTEVIAHDEERAWLLMRDAGTPIAVQGNPPEVWLRVLPRYAELQLDEAPHAGDHLAHGVTDRRLELLPALFEQLVARPDLPLAERPSPQRFAALCAELASYDLPASVQHDDLHMNNVAERDGLLRIVDWGDASIAHPFFSLVVTFRFLEQSLAPGDPWFDRLRDAYLEPWGRSLAGAFDLAQRVGWVAHALGWVHQRDATPPPERTIFEPGFGEVLARAFAAVDT